MTTKAEKLAAKNELSKLIFSLEILSKIKANQAANGIRLGDYVRYSQYCTKRMHRIRKKLKFHHGAKFKKKSITPEIVIDARYLELVLLFAERSWADSMRLKDMESDAHPRAKFHAKRKLAKSSRWAKHLLFLCNAKADARTVLEAESYSSWLWGNLLLEDEQWRSALEFLVKAKNVYVDLGKTGSNEHQALCQVRVSEIEPTIRYCKYNLSQGGTIDIEPIVENIIKPEPEVKEETPSEKITAPIESKQEQKLVNQMENLSLKDVEKEEKKLIQQPIIILPTLRKPMPDTAIDFITFPDLSQRMVEQKKKDFCHLGGVNLHCYNILDIIQFPSL